MAMSQRPPSDLPCPRPIQFFHQGRLRSVQGPVATRSVLSWLREEARCTGTKEGCNEGDCGACTVLLAELDGDDRLRFKPINSCLQFLPTLDGKALLTVEDLGTPGAPHPAQQAMVDCHGSQCGFCTPGFVISLAGVAERHAAASTVASRQQLADDLSGNLCRCTGYRPILDAGQQMFTRPTQRLGSPAMLAALMSLRDQAPLHYVGDDGMRFDAPHTVDALASLLAASPEATLLAGGTDIALWVNKQFKPLGQVISLAEVDGLRAIDQADGQLHIGAGASLQSAWLALAGVWPGLTEMGLRFASLPVREAGTLGGNLANGSPIGDAAPVLIALGASLLLRRADQQRRLLLQDFTTGYMQNQLQPGEWLQSVSLALPQPGEQLVAYKLSKRFDCDISALACGLWLKRDGERVTDVRLAFGGMAATVCRAPLAEAALRGFIFNEKNLQAAMAALAGDYQPMSDHRASARHRLRSARNLLWRFWLETGSAQPLTARQLSVWSRP